MLDSKFFYVLWKIHHTTQTLIGKEVHERSNAKYRETVSSKDQQGYNGWEILFKFQCVTRVWKDHFVYHFSNCTPINIEIKVWPNTVTLSVG